MVLAQWLIQGTDVLVMLNRVVRAPAGSVFSRVTPYLAQGKGSGQTVTEYRIPNERHRERSTSHEEPELHALLTLRSSQYLATRCRSTDTENPTALVCPTNHDAGDVESRLPVTPEIGQATHPWSAAASRCAVAEAPVRHRQRAEAPTRQQEALLLGQRLLLPR